MNRAIKNPDGSYTEISVDSGDCVEFAPIMEYESQEQLDENLKEWQGRLFLTGWLINAKIVDKVENVNDKPCIATNYHNHDQKTAYIEIQKISELQNQYFAKLCHEQSLVHELLHCNYCWFRYDESDADGAILNLHHHQLLEQMAKSLIMAKYNIPFEWFKNF